MGIASNIGADIVYENTKKLKQTLKEHLDFQDYLYKFYSSYTKLIDEIKAYLKE